MENAAVHLQLDIRVDVGEDTVGGSVLSDDATLEGDW